MSKAAAETPKAKKAKTYLERSEGASSKFWEVSVKGSEMRVRYGRIGTKGQIKTRSFDSPAAAKSERDTLIAAKKRKGYQ